MAGGSTPDSSVESRGASLRENLVIGLRWRQACLGFVSPWARTAMSSFAWRVDVTCVQPLGLEWASELRTLELSSGE